MMQPFLRNLVNIWFTPERVSNFFLLEIWNTIDALAIHDCWSVTQLLALESMLDNGNHLIVLHIKLSQLCQENARTPEWISRKHTICLNESAFQQSTRLLVLSQKALHTYIAFLRHCLLVVPNTHSCILI